MNNTTLPRQLSTDSEAKIIILCLILIACLFGNILVSSTILATKKLRTPSNILIVNLSMCDMLTASCAIPFTLIYNLYTGGDTYSYGIFGCKLLWPFSTYVHNCSVFTLAAIAVERYMSISSVNTRFTKRVTCFVIMVIHVCGLTAVIPYSVKLTIDDGKCNEKWEYSWQETAYTISLYMIQYVIPLIIMAIFYSLAWRKLYINNMFIINMSEEYERKMDWKRSYLIDLRKSAHVNDSLTLSSISQIVNKSEENKPRVPNDKRVTYVTVRDRAQICIPTEDVKRFNKSQFLSQESYIRHRQSVRTMKMFTVVVIVFAITSLPNHISWFLHGYQTLTPVITFLFIMVSYVSPVINCWIYGWFNSGIRIAYFQMMPCSWYHRRRGFNTQTSYNTTSSNMPISPSLYSRRQEEVFRRRMSLFNNIFREYKDNLYIEEETAFNENDENELVTVDTCCNI